MSQVDRNSLRSWLPKFSGLRTLRGRLMGLLGTMFLITLLVIGMSVVYFVRRTEAVAWRGRQGEAARNAAQIVAAFMQRADDALTLMSLLDRADLEARPQLLQDLLQQNRALLEVIRLDASGRVFASASRDRPVLADLFTIPQSQWFREAAAGRHYYSNVQISSQNEPYQIIALPVPDGGVAAARLHMNVLWEVVANIRFGEAGQTYAINHEGQIIAHTNPEVVLANMNISGRPEYIAWSQSPDNEWYGEYRNFEGDQVVGTTAVVSRTNWVVITELPQEEAYATSRRALLFLGGGIVLLATLVMWTTGRFLERLILRPVERLRDGAERIGQGDLDHRIAIIRQDEIGQVAAAFNEMAARLRDRESQLAARTAALAAEVAERQRAEEALRKLNVELEDRVRERTAELRDANERLNLELSERKRVEEQLRETFGKMERAKWEWEATVDALPELISLVDDHGRIIRANRTVEAWNLGRVTEVSGRGLHELVHTGCIDPSCYLNSLLKQAEEQTIQGQSVEHEAYDPILKRHVLVKVQPVLNRKQAASRAAVVVVQDVTERKQAEEALRESQRLLEKTFTSLRDAVFIVNADTTEILDCNPAASEIFGYSREEMLGRTTAFLHVNEAALAEFRGHLYPAVAEKGFLYLPEFRMKRKDGTVFPTEHNVMPLEDEHGKRIGWVSVVRDITERKQMEEALRRRAEELTALQKTLLDIAAPHDLPALLQTIVERAALLLNAPSGGLYLCDPDQREVCCVVSYNTPRDYTGTVLKYGEGAAGTVAQTGEPLIIDDYRTWSGRATVFEEKRPFTAVLSAPMIWQGQVTGVIHVLHDVESRRFTEADLELLTLFANHAAIAVENARLVEALRQRTTELEARNEELDAFAHTVAHDLKSPLTLITGFAEILSTEHTALPAEEVLHYVHKIAQSGHRMRNIVDELLLLAEVRKAEVEMKPLDTASIVAEAQGRLAYMIEESQAEIVVPEVWPAASGHAPWVEEVWVNYISNAIKYGGRPPRVELGFLIADFRLQPVLWPGTGIAEAPPGEDQSKIQNLKSQIKFWVRDNGPGLTPEEQVRLFTPFTRLDQVRARGHGLGLSIVRRIVEKLGGRAGVESEVGRGSVFYFTLPAAEHVA